MAFVNKNASIFCNNFFVVLVAEGRIWKISTISAVLSAEANEISAVRIFEISNRIE